MRLNTLLGLLKEKSTALKALDDEVLSTCPTNEIEREGGYLLEDCGNPSVWTSEEAKKKKAGETRDESVIHVVSDTDNFN